MWISALLLAAGLVVMQVLLGGWWFPALAIPGYVLVGAAAVGVGLIFWWTEDAPSAWCIGVTLLFAGYLFWRQSSSPDWYVAREDTWLLLGALAVYGISAWYLRESGPRWLLVGVLLSMATMQVFIVVAQFAADASFHPFPDLAKVLDLAHGEGGVNYGWASGTLANRTGVSGVLQFTTFLSLGLLLWGRGGAALKMVLLWSTMAGFAGLALSLSRSAYLGATMGLAAFALASFFVLRRGVSGRKGWIIGGGALLVVLISLGVGLGIGSESFTVQQRVAILQLDDFRQNLWFLTVPPMLELQPWTGLGANMFDQLSWRYRGEGFEGFPIHAHNDWLQMRIEYGIIGLGLALIFFVVHLSSGWRNAMRMARELGADMGNVPQGMSLGLTMGALGAFVAQGVHAFFDYGTHIPAVALLTALGAGWLAGARREANEWSREERVPTWLRPMALMASLFGAILLWQIYNAGGAEIKAWRADNALRGGDAEMGWDLALEGLEEDPTNPRLFILAGESAVVLAEKTDEPLMKREWYWRAAQNFGEAIRERPLYAYPMRERAAALDRSGHGDMALPVHLRGIGRDPDQARGYEYLALHYWIAGKRQEAARLFEFSKKRPAAMLSHRLLPKLDEEIKELESQKETPIQQ